MEVCQLVAVCMEVAVCQLVLVVWGVEWQLVCPDGMLVMKVAVCPVVCQLV